MFNVELRVDDSHKGSHKLPYMGDFVVLQDGLLVKGTRDGLETYCGYGEYSSFAR